MRCPVVLNALHFIRERLVESIWLRSGPIGIYRKGGASDAAAVADKLGRLQLVDGWGFHFADLLGFGSV
jgi:hypothetical protein